MNRRTILTHILGSVALAMGAQVNSPLAEGYQSRGVAMERNANYAGSDDQLSKLMEMRPTPSAAEQARYCLAMSALHEGGPAVEETLRSFLADYPVSGHRTEVMMALADHYFDLQEYALALAAYNDVDPLALNERYTADRDYRRAYCLLKMADYDEARGVYVRLAADPTYANDANFYLGYIDYVKGDYGAANSHFAAVEKKGNPTDLTDFYLAQIYFVDGDYQKSLQTAESLLKANVDDSFKSEMRRIAGESLYQLGRDRDAIRQLKAYAEATDHPLPSAMYILGVSQYRTADYEAAIRSLTAPSTQENAMGQSACLYIGQALLQQGNYDAAMMAFEKAQRLNFDSQVKETAFFNYAVASMRGGKVPFGSTVTTFEEFLRRYPSSVYAPEIEEYVVTGYMTDNNYAAALQSIERIKNPNDKILRAKQVVLYTLGTRELLAGRLAQAEDHLRQSQKLAAYDPQLATEADLWLGEALYKQGRYAEAAREYEKYLADAPRKAENRPLAQYDLGYALFGMREFAKAREAFEKFAKAPGTSSKASIADAQNRIADCLYYASDFKGAADAYDRAYATLPEAGDYPLYQKGLMKGLSRDHQGKIADLTALASRFPTSALLPSALLEMGESYTDLGRSDKAIETFSQLAVHYPSTAQGRQGYLLLAITYLNAGNKPQAIETYKKVISNFPTSDEARAAADDLKHIYADAGSLQDYVEFVNSVPNAPKLEASEVDQLTFAAAEKAYVDKGDSRQLRDYVEHFAEGASRADALAYLVEAEFAQGHMEQAHAYAVRLSDEHPDASQTLRILPLKARIENETGRGEMALATYRSLEQRASSAAELNTARLGILRTARALDMEQEVVDAADKLLSSSAPLMAEKSEVSFAKALSLSRTGHEAEAEQIWGELAANPSDLFGTKSAFYLAQHLFDSGRTAEADKQVNALIDANPPYDYWMARSFILLSDIRRKQGDVFEANEYLRSLNENYPGSEADIFQMIEQRLK